MKRKITIAKDLLNDYRRVLLADNQIASLIEKLKEAIMASEKERIKTGIAGICARCGSLNHDCCGKGIELRYSLELIFINLLLDVNPPEYRHREDSCYFLSQRGCSLKARDVFCVNFLCRRITDSIKPTKLVQLQRHEGEMLDLIFRLEELLKKFDFLSSPL